MSEIDTAGAARRTAVDLRPCRTNNNGTVAVGGVGGTDPAGGRDEPSIKMVESFEHRLMFGEDERELNHPSTALRR